MAKKKAIIYRLPKNVMQSGRGKTEIWVLEYDEEVTHAPEPLNGWTSASNTAGQVQLKFQRLDQAQAFAQKQNFDVTIKLPSNRKIRPRNYVDNFKYIPPED